MAGRIQKGRIKNVHRGSKATKDLRNGEIKPNTGNLRDVKFTTNLNVGLGDFVEFRNNEGIAEILKITRKAK